MSAGHAHGTAAAGHPIDAEHSALLDKLLDDPSFTKAVSAYKSEDDSHDVPYLGGSNDDGTTIYFDRGFVQAVKAGQVTYDGKPFDPRPFIKVHEAVEGALIRLVDGMDYPKAHDLATVAERHAVEHAGMGWGKYQASLAPQIHADETEAVRNPPPDILREAYRGSPLFDKMGAPLLAHAAVAYGPSKPGGDCCEACRYFVAGTPPHCQIVLSPIVPNGWCKRYEASPMQKLPMKGMPPMPMRGTAPAMGATAAPAATAPATDARGHSLSMASATHLHNAGHISTADRDRIHASSKQALNRQAAKPRAKAKAAPPAAPAPFGSLAPLALLDKGGQR